MIVTFEEHTEDLTDREKDFLPDVQEAIKYALEKSLAPRKQNDLLVLINNYLQDKHGLFCSLTLNGVRLRKYVNYIRSNALMPIIATSQGYSLTENKEVIELQIKSLLQRSHSIHKAAIGLKNYISSL